MILETTPNKQNCEPFAAILRRGIELLAEIGGIVKSNKKIITVFTI